MTDVEKRLYSPKFLWGLLAVNVVIRVLWIIYMHPPQKADFDWYFTHAVMMADGKGYVWNGQPTAYWPIGWPAALAVIVKIFGPHMMAGLFFNALLSTGIVALVYLLAIRVFHSNKVAAAAAIGYTLLPSHVMWNAILGSEELFTILLVLSIYVYLGVSESRVRAWMGPVMLAGVVMGLASDVRPIPILFPVLVLLYEWFVRGRRWVQGFQRAVVYGLAMVVGILPVTIRNYIAMHHFVLVSTNGGVNLWQGTHTDSGYFWSWLDWINPLLKAGNNEILKDQIGKTVAMQHITAHPYSTVIHGFKKIISLYDNDVNVVWYTFHVVDDRLTKVMDWFATDAYFLFMILALIGLVATFRVGAHWKAALLPLLWIVYNTAIFMFFPAWDRFRYPLMPLFSIFLGYSVIALVPKWRRELRPSADTQ